MGLLAAYSFDGAGDTVVDHSGNGRDFTLAATSGVRIAEGHTGGGLGSTVSASTVLIAQPAPFGQTPDRTAMLWARGSGGVWYVRWNIGSIGSGGWGILLLNGLIRAWARNASGVSNPGVAVPSDGLWHHYAATYGEAAGTVTFFLDGVAAASAVIAGPLRTDADRLDVAEWGPGTTIDDLRIYDEVLTAEQITTLMNTPVGGEPPPLTGWPPAIGEPTTRQLAVVGAAVPGAAAAAIGTPTAHQLAIVGPPT